MAQVLINGSHGTLVVDVETGAVMEYQISCDDKQQCRYNSIKAIDSGTNSTARGCTSHR